MVLLELVLVVAWVTLVAVVPGYLRHRRTGEPTMRFADRPGSPQWWSRLLSVVGILLALAAPLAELAGLAPFPVLAQPAVRAAGVVLAVIGGAITIASQLAMGDSWRGDVDPDVHMELITEGPFRVVRNPIFTGSAVTATGLALVVPNVLSLAMLIVFMTSLEIQVRLVEEPYLVRSHGDAYRSYAARTGRFLPGIGRLRSQWTSRHGTVIPSSLSRHARPRSWSEGVGTRPTHRLRRTLMRRLFLAATIGLLAVSTLAGTVNAGRTFGGAYADDALYRVFGNRATVPDGTGTDPFATFTNSTNPAQLGVAEFAPGTIGHHGGRWAVYRATWTASGDPSELVTSWDELQSLVGAGAISLVRDAAADFRCPVLGNPEPID